MYIAEGLFGLSIFGFAGDGWQSAPALSIKDGWPAGKAKMIQDCTFDCFSMTETQIACSRLLVIQAGSSNISVEERRLKGTSSFSEANLWTDSM